MCSREFVLLPTVHKTVVQTMLKIYTNYNLKTKRKYSITQTVVLRQPSSKISVFHAFCIESTSTARVMEQLKFLRHTRQEGSNLKIMSPYSKCEWGTYIL